MPASYAFIGICQDACVLSRWYVLVVFALLVLILVYAHRPSSTAWRYPCGPTLRTPRSSPRPSATGSAGRACPRELRKPSNDAPARDSPPPPSSRCERRDPVRALLAGPRSERRGRLSAYSAGRVLPRSTRATRPRSSSCSMCSRLEHPEVRVVRLRPGLIFKRDAASEIRRLLRGPAAPQRRSCGRSRIPIVPDTPRPALPGRALARRRRRLPARGRRRGRARRIQRRRRAGARLRAARPRCSAPAACGCPRASCARRRR